MSSNNGPRMENEKLNKIKETIIGGAGSNDDLKLMNKAFFGDQSNSNLFARIVRGEEEQWRVWEDQNHVSFLTPFPNTPGYTVVVPRTHLPSDVCGGLEDEDYKKLMVATHQTGRLVQKAMDAEDYAIICEGLEIDYAHVKVIPIYKENASKCLQAATTNTSQQTQKKFYSGYVSSAPGVEESVENLNSTHSKLCTLKAPKTWKDPKLQAVSAMHSPWYRAMFKLQNTLYDSTNYYFKSILYNYVLTPVTTQSISSPMGLGSDSLPVHVNILGQDVFLADSMQFNLEYTLRMGDDLPGVYYVSSSFRGEDPDQTHLNQFYHVECELRGS